MKSETTEAHEKLSTDKIIGGVITLSDSITDVNDDISGKILADAIEAKYTLASRKLIPDDRNDLTQAIEEMLENVDFIITTGGTGLNERDITVETVEKLFDKKMEGFGELYRQEPCLSVRPRPWHFQEAENIPRCLRQNVPGLRRRA